MDSKDIIENVELRCLQISDYRELCSSMTDAYASWVGGTCWRESDIERLLEAFPQGQFCVTVNGKVVASALTLVVNYSRFGDNHTYTQITGTTASAPTIPTAMSSMASKYLSIPRAADCA